MSFIVIEHYQFPIRDPYTEGHVMTDIEAKVLNWHRARLIQRLIQKNITEAIENSPNDILNPAEVDVLKQYVKLFDQQYELSFKKEPNSSILEYHLDNIARGILSLNGISNPREEDIELVKRTPQVQDQARAKIRSGRFSFEDLLTS